MRPTSVKPGAGKGDQELLDGAEQGNLEKVKALIEAHKDDPSYINGSDKMGATGKRLYAKALVLIINSLALRIDAKLFGCV